MKFFKHFVDAHRGKSLLALKRKYGLAGVGRYWTLMEMCAEKMEKNKGEEFNEAHCNFEFDKHFLMRELGYGNLVHLGCYLSAIEVLGLCSISADDVVIKCYVPKLLESLDRDSRRARTERAPSAPKIKIKDKEKEYKEEVEEEPEGSNALAQKKQVAEKEIWFVQLAKLYKELFPSTTKGQKAQERFESQVENFEAAQDLEKAIRNYANYLSSQQWRQPKTTFETFLGTKKSGYFWREFIDFAGAEVAASIDEVLR